MKVMPVLRFLQPAKLRELNQHPVPRLYLNVELDAVPGALILR